MQLLNSNKESISKTLIRYDKMALLIVNDAIQKTPTDFLYVEKGEDGEFYVGTKTQDKKRTTRTYTLEEYLTQNITLTKFVEKYSSQGMTKALAEHTQWIKDLINIPAIVVEDVCELFAINIKAFYHVFLSKICKDLALQRGATFKTPKLCPTQIDVGQIGNNAEYATNKSLIRPNRFWSNWIYEAYKEVNCYDNLNLARLYLASLGNKVGANADRERISYLTDFVPVLVKFSGVDFTYFEQEREQLSATHIFQKVLAVKNPTMSGGSLDKVSKDSTSIQDSFTYYTTKGQFHKAFGVYPKMFNAHMHYAYMSVFYSIFMPNAFHNIRQYVYLNHKERRALAEQDYETRLSRGEIDSADYIRQLNLEEVLKKGAQAYNYQQYKTSPELREVITRVSEKLLSADLADMLA